MWGSKDLGSPAKGLKMEIVFKRRLTNELLTTYLPSFLLLLMAYATTFFKEFYFEAAVTVNLSILLVTTTLFVRWEIFPYWRYFKDRTLCQRHGKASCNILCSFSGYMADLLSADAFHWGQILRAYTVLCCTVVMLNLKVTLTTVAEFYNEDNNTINHHGFKRKVGIEEEKVFRFARDFSHKSIFPG